VPWLRRLLLCILVAAGIAVIASFAMSWFSPIVKVSDISRVRGR
jgi:hypothetical protein